MNMIVMNNITTKGVLSATVLSLLIACNSGNENSGKAEAATPAIDKEQIKKEIQTKENDFATLYNNAELKDIGYYADDATSFYPNRAPLVGKDSIVSFLKSDLAGNTDKISFQTNDVFVSDDGNQVVEVGYFKVMDSANNLMNSGNYMSLFVKRNGKYVCLRDMSASDMPRK